MKAVLISILSLFTFWKKIDEIGDDYKKNDDNDDDNDDLGAGDRELTFLNLPRTRCTPCLLLPPDRSPRAASLESLFRRR